MKKRATDRRSPIGNLLYSLRPRFCDRDQARRAPAGLGPSGDDQGQGRDGRPPVGARRHSLRPRHAVRVPRRRGARKPVPLPSTPPYSLPASHPVAHGDAPYGRSSRKPALRAYGFPPQAAEPSVFQLAPRYPPSASWGLRRRLRRGWTGEGFASLPPTMMEPALVGPGDLRWPRYRASVCCSGSPKRIRISSRKQCDRPDLTAPLLSNGQDGTPV